MVKIMFTAIMAFFLTISSMPAGAVPEAGGMYVEPGKALQVRIKEIVEGGGCGITQDITDAGHGEAEVGPKEVESGSEEVKSELKKVESGSEEVESEQPEKPGMKPEDREPEELAVHFLDVGQGDCTLITCGGAAMLIDAGDDSQGTRVQKYLQKQGIRSLDYVVCTHFDADHIGGMDVILYKFDCDIVFMTEGEADTIAYRDVAETMEIRGYERTLPVAGEQYSLGDAAFTIVGPLQTHDNENDNSIALLLSHGENTFLFTGDASEEEERDLADGDISLDADVYKAGHHGSKTSSAQELLEKVSPEYAVISCGEDNPYGHPHAETLNKLREMDVQVYRTDEQGTIIAISDGREITWNCSPSDTWQAGEPGGTAGSGRIEEQEAAVAGSEDAGITYVCNVNTGKFHDPGCASVRKMSEKNKWEVTVTRDELIDMGYVPCKICNP